MRPPGFWYNSKTDLEDALKFYRIELVKTDSTLFREAEKTSEILRSWRCVLRKDKTMAHIHHMEEQSDGSRTTITEATEILHSPQVWEFFDGLVSKAIAGGSGIMGSSKLENATYLLAHAVMINSVQRPGAVINLTVAEFENNKKESSSGGDVWVIRVHRHKTMFQGSANLLLTEPLMRRMQAYLKHLRSLTLGSDITDNFFLKNHGLVLDHMSSRVEVRVEVLAKKQRNLILFLQTQEM